MSYANLSNADLITAMKVSENKDYTTAEQLAFRYGNSNLKSRVEEKDLPFNVRPWFIAGIVGLYVVLIALWAMYQEGGLITVMFVLIVVCLFVQALMAKRHDRNIDKQTRKILEIRLPEPSMIKGLKDLDEEHLKQVDRHHLEVALLHHATFERLRDIRQSLYTKIVHPSGKLKLNYSGSRRLKEANRKLDNLSESTIYQKYLAKLNDYENQDTDFLEAKSHLQGVQ